MDALFAELDHRPLVSPQGQLLAHLAMRGLTAQLRRLSTVRFVRVESFPKQGKRSAEIVRRVNSAKWMGSRTVKVVRIKVSITRTIRTGLDRALTTA